MVWVRVVISCPFLATPEPPVESEGAACRLEAVFLHGLYTFVHLWALAHFVPFLSHPTHATKGYHQWCGCPQPLAPLVSPGGGLGHRCCATCASASGDFPPWQSRRTLTTFSTSLQHNTCGRSKDASREGFPHWNSLWAVPMAMLWFRSRPKSAPEPCGTPSVYTHACKILQPRFAHRLQTFSSYLMLPHTRML